MAGFFMVAYHRPFSGARAKDLTAKLRISIVQALPTPWTLWFARL